MKIEDVGVGRWLEGKEGKRRDERWGKSWGVMYRRDPLFPTVSVLNGAIDRMNGV